MNQPRPSLARYAWLSIGGAVFTIGLKTGAWYLTGSVGLLSDALESVVNLVAAVLALVVLVIAARPADEGHPFGHEKAEYFSSGAEGVLILVAAALIIVSAGQRLLDLQPLQQTGLGSGLAILASLINYGIARILSQAATRYESVTLEADSQHLMADVWTTAGVLLGVIAVKLTGWLWLDPVIALAVALHIVRTGWSLVRDSVSGLMDTALPESEQQVLRDILESYRSEGVQYHALLTQRAASRRFVSVHVLVPGAWSVQQGHDVLERIEAEMRVHLSRLTVVTHLEPVEDPASWEDQEISGW